MQMAKWKYCGDRSEQEQPALARFMNIFGWAKASAIDGIYKK